MTPAEIRAAYKAALGKFEQVSIRRYSGSVPDRSFVDYPCRARVTGFAPHELVGDIRQGDRRVLALAEDLETSQFPAPVRHGDAVMLASGKELSVEASDDATRRVGGVLIAYDIVARG